MLIVSVSLCSSQASWPLKPICQWYSKKSHSPIFCCATSFVLCCRCLFHRLMSVELMNIPSCRYDEPSSHPYLRAGGTHGASQGQRQPQTLTGIWGEQSKGSKAKDSLEYWFLSDCVFIVREHFSSREICFFPLLLTMPVVSGAWAIMKYQLCTACFFPLHYSLNMAKQGNCLFQLYKISLSRFLQLLNPQMQFPQILA